MCSLQISTGNWKFYRFFLNVNGISFYFHFLQGTLYHPPCYLIKRALFKAWKTRIFKILSLRPKLNVPKSSPLQKVSQGVGDRFILTNSKIICARFESSQPPVSLEITTKNVTGKGVDLFIKYILRLILCGLLLPCSYLFLLKEKNFLQIKKHEILMLSEIMKIALVNVL